MNKLFIILLAIGLASAHTFVKRDAPVADVAEKNYVDIFRKEVEGLAENVKKALDPDTIKKNFNDIVDKVTSAVPTNPVALFCFGPLWNSSTREGPGEYNDGGASTRLPHSSRAQADRSLIAPGGPGPWTSQYTLRY